MDAGRAATLLAICLVSFAAGEALARLHVPRLPVYLAAGALSGVVLSTAEESANLAYPTVSSISLGVIGFVAGSHLAWQTIKPRVRPIAFQVVGMSLVVPVLVSVVVALVLSNKDVEIQVAAALLTGAVMLALSPPEAIAIISESRSAGPFTRLVLGATVVMDVVVVAAFSAAMTIAHALVGEGGSFADVVVSVTVGLTLAATAGLVVGGVLSVTIPRAARGVVAAAVIVLAAGLTVWLAVLAVQWAEDRLGLEIEVESLLVAMVAGVYVANRSAARDMISKLLEHLAPYVYVVFFTLTGLGLHLDALLAAAPAALALWAVRGSGLWVGSRGAMALAREPATVRRVAWRAFIPQAGIALALASTVAAEFPEFGEVFAVVVIGTIVINEASGPFFLRSALDAVGETAPKEEILH